MNINSSGNSNQEICIKEHIQILPFKNFPLCNTEKLDIQKHASQTKLIYNKQNENTLISGLKTLKYWSNAK